MILILTGKTSFGRFVVESDVDVDRDIETGEHLFSVVEILFDGETEEEQTAITAEIDKGNFNVEKEN